MPAIRWFSRCCRVPPSWKLKMLCKRCSTLRLSRCECLTLKVRHGARALVLAGAATGKKHTFVQRRVRTSTLRQLSKRIVAMTIVKRKPTSPGRRFVISVISPDLHKGAPYAPLLEKKSKSGGRNNNGRITSRHIGGGHKQHYPKIDFRRNKDGIPLTVELIAYDRNRTAIIAFVFYADGERRYIIAPKGLKAGDQIQSGEAAPIKARNTLPLRNVPLGSTVHCIELKPGKGAQMARSAGASASLVARDGGYATLRLRSGETRKVLAECRATLGEVSNGEHSLRSLGKAGASRWRGVRPTVRGVAMNPVDHPHGGGEGRSSSGRHPVTPWGVPTKGYKTRKNKRTTNMIVRGRTKK